MILNFGRVTQLLNRVEEQDIMPQRPSAASIEHLSSSLSIPKMKHDGNHIAVLEATIEMKLLVAVLDDVPLRIALVLI